MASENTAPLAAEPRQLLVVLNLARRKALYQLVSDITASMRSELDPAGSPEQEPGPASQSPSGGASLPSAQGPAGPNPPPASGPDLAQLQRAALAHFDEWRKATLSQLREVASAAEDAKTAEARRQRAEQLARAETPRSAEENLISFDDAPGPDDDAAVRALQARCPPAPTRLTTIPAADRREVLSCVLLVLLAGGRYAAQSHVLAVRLASSLALPLAALTAEETAIATTLVAAAAEAPMSADAEAQRRRVEGQASRYWKVGLASVAGAAVIGITGGLAAPVVAGAIGGLMGSVGLGGVASFLGIFWMNGALVGTLFGAFGAKMTGEMMDKYAREVEDFSFLPLRDAPEPPPAGQPTAASTRRLRLTIGINGWLTSADDVTRPWRALADDTEVFALRFEVESLLALGTSLDGLVSSYAWRAARAEILRRTVLATLWSALWPVHILRAATAVDNPFAHARNRADKAGAVLADALIAGVQGARPVTLAGYSLGARVVHACLRTLARRRAFGLVADVVLVGAPVPSSPARWREMRSVVAGNLYNVFSRNDYVLAFLYRAASAQLGVAGLQSIDGVPGVVNLDLSDHVSGHLRYPDLLPHILARCGFPDVRGGDGPIESEKDDPPAAEEAGSTLIELDDLPVEDLPASALSTQPARTPEVDQPRNPARNAVTRTPSDMLEAAFDPLVGLGPQSVVVKPLARPARRPRELGEGSRSQPALPTVKQKRPAPARAARVPTEVAREEEGKRPALVASKTAPAAIVSSFDGHRFAADESDDEGGGIRMMDNDDDMVAYEAPLVVED